jgi:hypothetical protein
MVGFTIPGEVGLECFNFRAQYVVSTVEYALDGNVYVWLEFQIGGVQVKKRDSGCHEALAALRNSL